MKMKTVSLVILGAFILASTAMTAIVETPSYKEGDKWRIRHTLTSVTGISRSDALPSGTYDIVYRGGRFIWYAAASGDEIVTDGVPVAEGLRGEDAIVFFGKYEDNVPWLAFPLAVGDKRTYKYFKRVIGSKRGVWLDGEVTVEGLERIKTEAGELDAYKHIMEESGGRITRSFVYYYAPACKCIAKLSAQFGSGSSREVELLRYEVK